MTSTFGGQHQMTSEEFLDLLTHCEAQIMGYLLSVCSRGDDVEDIFQQTVLTMWQKIDQFEPGTNFLAWACTIAKFKVLESSRANRRLLFGDELVSNLAESFGNQDLELRLARKRALVGCLANLRDSDRHLVDVCYQSDKTIAHVAGDIGRSVRSVYKSLSRIRKALFQCIQSKLAQEGHGRG